MPSHASPGLASARTPTHRARPRRARPCQGHDSPDHACQTAPCLAAPDPANLTARRLTSPDPALSSPNQDAPRARPSHAKPHLGSDLPTEPHPDPGEALSEPSRNEPGASPTWPRLALAWPADPARVRGRGRPSTTPVPPCPSGSVPPMPYLAVPPTRPCRCSTAAGPHPTPPLPCHTAPAHCPCRACRHSPGRARPAVSTPGLAYAASTCRAVRLAHPVRRRRVTPHRPSPGTSSRCRASPSLAVPIVAPPALAFAVPELSHAPARASPTGPCRCHAAPARRAGPG